MSKISFPIGSSVTLEALDADLHILMHQLREAEPVSWLPSLDAWLVSSYELSTIVMRDAKTFTVDHPGFSTGQVVGESMLSLDGDHHKKHRMPFEKPFRKKAVLSYFSDVVSNYSDDLLKNIKKKNGAELRREFAGPIAVKTMIAALGLEAIDVSTLLTWYDDIVEAVSLVTAGQDVSKSGHTAFKALQESLLPSLQSDNNNMLSAASGVNSGLSDEQIISNAAILLFGGIETTEGMIVNALYHLLDNPESLEKVRDNPNLIPTVVEESLRLEPAASVVDRYATKGTQLDGVSIKKNDLVRVSLAAANRDPSVFPEPDRFDVNRTNLKSHVSFAQGPHVCLGLHLARLEAELALEKILTHLPKLNFDPSFPKTLAEPRGLVFRKPEALHVLWTRSS